MRTDIGLLVLRVTSAGMMLFAHGWGKLANFSMISHKFPDPLGVGSTLSLAMAVFGEVVCPIAIILGIRVKYVAIPALITMLVAAFIVHSADPFAKKEFALLYAIPFLTLAITGGGSFGLDRFLPGKKD